MLSCNDKSKAKKGPNLFNGSSVVIYDNTYVITDCINIKTTLKACSGRLLRQASNTDTKVMT